MSINRDKPDLWKSDILQSVDLYNSWFMEFAPKGFRETCVTTENSVERALIDTNYLKNILVELLKNHPEVLLILRMSTCPPIARDRLVGLAGVTKSLVENMEDAEGLRVSPRMAAEGLSDELSKIAQLSIGWQIWIFLFGYWKSVNQPNRKLSVPQLSSQKDYAVR